jgi:hypothetical protein
MARRLKSSLKLRLDNPLSEQRKKFRRELGW